MKTKFETIDQYHSAFPKKVQEFLEDLRNTIKQAAPKSEETISYNMPAFRLNGTLVYYAGYKNHIGFYPTSSPIKIFKEQLRNYKTSKGAIQFPIDKGIPKTLVKQIVRYRMNENLKKMGTKAKRKTLH